MPLPQGINFRSTSGYVTDVSPSTYELGGSTNYPRTTPQGNTVGYSTYSGVTQTRNRNNGNDARLAGTHWIDTGAGTVNVFRIDLPVPGEYKVRLALGDASYATNYQTEVRDGASTILTTLSGTTSAANRFIDASGVERTNANWPANNVAVQFTFANSFVVFRQERISGGVAAIAHAYVEPAYQSRLPKINMFAALQRSGSW